MFKPVVIDPAQFREPSQAIDESGIKRVFMVMHGYYGNLFLSKFATGNVEHGEDQGIANARRIWAYGLRDFDAETVKTALRQCQQRHPEFPPSLPQFVSLCAANKPREVYRAAVPALEMGQPLRSRYAAQARAINERHAKKVLERATGFIELPATLDGLKQAIANAVAEAGGDEGATLLRLDRELTRRAA